MIRRSMLNKSDVTWGFPLLYNCNIWDGCIHNCVYCYWKIKMQGYGRKIPWNQIDKAENAVELINQEKFIRPQGHVMFCSTTDPYQTGRDHAFTRACLTALGNSPHEILILTKSDDVMQDFDIIESHHNIQVGFTFIDHKGVEPSKLEPGAPSILRRRYALEQTRKSIQRDVETFVSIEPWWPHLTDPKAIMLELGMFVDRWIIGKLNHIKTDDAYYIKELPPLVDWMMKVGADFYIKPELAVFLPRGYPARNNRRVDNGQA